MMIHGPLSSLSKYGFWGSASTRLVLSNLSQGLAAAGIAADTANTPAAKANHRGIDFPTMV
jgi:hypothetical protein